MANERRRLVGRVTSAKMNKTIVIAVDVSKRHPVYDKVIHETRKFYAHDEENIASVGDLVQVVECRPLSKLKRWALEVILQQRDIPELIAPGAERIQPEQSQVQE